MGRRALTTGQAAAAVLEAVKNHEEAQIAYREYWDSIAAPRPPFAQRPPYEGLRKATTAAYLTWKATKE